MSAGCNNYRWSSVFKNFLAKCNYHRYRIKVITDWQTTYHGSQKLGLYSPCYASRYLYLRVSLCCFLIQILQVMKLYHLFRSTYLRKMCNLNTFEAPCISSNAHNSSPATVQSGSRQQPGMRARAPDVISPLD